VVTSVDSVSVPEPDSAFALAASNEQLLVRAAEAAWIPSAIRLNAMKS